MKRILVVHDVASGLWGFPKGGQKRGERIFDTAQRELREETGKVIDRGITIIDVLSWKKHKLYVARGDFTPQCKVNGYEIDGYDWVTLDELYARRTSVFTRHFLVPLAPILQKN
jgi:8-oxo-dGTP pyrophosphatase MutT (NUDIX family)